MDTLAWTLIALLGVDAAVVAFALWLYNRLDRLEGRVDRWSFDHDGIIKGLRDDVRRLSRRIEAMGQYIDGRDSAANALHSIRPRNGQQRPH